MPVSTINLGARAAVGPAAGGSGLGLALWRAGQKRGKPGVGVLQHFHEQVEGVRPPLGQEFQQSLHSVRRDALRLVK